MAMNCPKCDALTKRVMGKGAWRRYECVPCGSRFSTMEVVFDDDDKVGRCRRTPVTDGVRLEMTEKHAAGATLTALAEEYGLHMETVRKLTRKTKEGETHEDQSEEAAPGSPVASVWHLGGGVL